MVHIRMKLILLFVHLLNAKLKKGVNVKVTVFPLGSFTEIAECVEEVVVDTE